MITMTGSGVALLFVALGALFALALPRDHTTED
jgi:hypothetical protein